MGHIFASIIIPTYDRKSHLSRLLPLLLNQTFPKDKYEVIVIDDGSDDGTAELFNNLNNNRLPVVKYFFQKRNGPAAARNRGIKEANGEIIIFTDSDCMPADNWVDEIVKGYDDDRLAGIGGIIRGMPNNIIGQYCAYIKMNEKPKIVNGDIVYLITGNASFKRSALEEVSGFDARYNFPGGEDPDLCYRLKQKGYAFCFNRRAIVFNNHKNNLFDLIKTYFNYGKGDFFLILKMNCSWDLTTLQGAKFTLYFIKCCIRIIIIALNFFLISTVNLIKIPFNFLKYYGEGLSVRISLIYSFLDYLVIISFGIGGLFGYITGKLKGFKKTTGNFD